MTLITKLNAENTDEIALTAMTIPANALPYFCARPMMLQTTRVCDKRGILHLTSGYPSIYEKIFHDAPYCELAPSPLSLLHSSR